MHFYFVPSLQSTAATQIVTRLWNRADVVALIAEWKIRAVFRGLCWSDIEARVNEKVSLLPPLPASLREKISSVVVPIGDQIREWKVRHVEEFGFKNIPRGFCWTSLGTLNKKTTAEAFVRDLTLPELERYDMACLYCIEWDGPVPFRLEWVFPFPCPRETEALCAFVAYWTYDRTRDATALDSTLERDFTKSPYQCAFDCAVQYCNEVAAEYYLHKLSPVEREESLSDVQLACYPTDFDLFRFLLRHMSERQQSELCKSRAELVLDTLLEYPWQPFYMDVACRVRDILSRHEYSCLLSKIVDKIRGGYDDYNYRELFGQLCVQIPMDHKKHLMSDCHLLSELFRGMDEKIISLVFKGLSPEEKEEILFSDEGLRICKTLANCREWDSLRSFIGECITSLDRMWHFRDECDEKGDFGGAYFHFLCELIDKCSENGGGEEAGCSVPERLCSSSDVPTDQV